MGDEIYDSLVYSVSNMSAYQMLAAIAFIKAVREDGLLFKAMEMKVGNMYIPGGDTYMCLTWLLP